MTSRMSVVAVSLLLAAGCTGDISGATGAASRPGQTPAATTPPRAPAAPAAPVTAPLEPVGDVPSPEAFRHVQGDVYALQTLSVSQYRHIVEDVLGEKGLRFPDLLLDPASSTVNGKDLMVSLFRAATVVASAAFAANGKLAGYCGAAGPDAACARRFVEEIGPRLFRRRLAREEVDRLAGVFAASADLGPLPAMSQVLVTMLISPSFFTVAETPGGGPRLAGEQIATRLALFLWDSAPDADLLARAGRGELETRAGVEAAVGRMTASPKFERFIERFVDSWLGLAALDGIVKAGTLTLFNATVAAAMETETRTFVGAIFASEKSSFAELLTSPTSFVNRSLAKIYGLDSTKFTDADFTRTDVSAGGQRKGLLTQPSLMTLLSLPTEPSVAMRGVFVLRNLTCSPPPPPPADVPPLAERTAANPTTLRERVAAHRNNPACEACHRSIDGVGLGFEAFDAIGRYHADEDGKPLTGEGVLYPSNGQPISFRGAAALGQLLADSKDARLCFMNHLFERSLLRKATRSEVPDLERLAARFLDDGNMRRLVTDYALGDSFATRRFD